MLSCSCVNKKKTLKHDDNRIDSLRACFTESKLIEGSVAIEYLQK